MKNEDQKKLEELFEEVARPKKFIQDEPVTSSEAEESGEEPNPESVQNIEDVVQPPADVHVQHSSKKRVTRNQANLISRIAHQCSKQGMHTLGLKILQAASRMYKLR
jgi:hypothetical protein